mmetsp:Transcript_38616/g.87803  ORF Transcript_38616/g.87803 Transcript_38616/m.87803 type:complete len:84 (+) Transcript_38616:289-540(+)
MVSTSWSARLARAAENAAAPGDSAVVPGGSGHLLNGPRETALLQGGRRGTLTLLRGTAQASLHFTDRGHVRWRRTKQFTALAP